MADPDRSTHRLFRTLSEAAWADERLAPEEERLLCEYAKGMGLTPPEASRILGTVKGAPPLPPHIPLDPLEAEWFCSNLVDVACADGSIDVREHAFLNRILGRFGIEEKEVDEMIRERLRKRETKNEL